MEKEKELLIMTEGDPYNLDAVEFHQNLSSLKKM